MKTSTKLLFTLQAIVIIGLFALNVVLKSRVDKNLSKAIQQEAAISAETDSLQAK
jgi:hypothetical protein